MMSIVERKYRNVNQKATLIIRSCDLGTGVESHTELVVESKHEPHAQRKQMVSAVKKAHPDAKPRSFANGAATFLAPNHLIITSYVDSPVNPHEKESRQQDSLFTA